MLKLKGIKLSILQEKYKVLGDLLSYEGPFFSHLANENNEDFLMMWCDKDQKYNRWVLYRTTFELLHDYFNGKISDVDLIQNNPDGFVYFVDIDKAINWETATLVPVEDIPADYLPEKKARFGADGFDPYAYRLKDYINLYFGRKNKLYPLPKEPAAAALHEPKDPKYKRKK